MRNGAAVIDFDRSGDLPFFDDKIIISGQFGDCTVIMISIFIILCNDFAIGVRQTQAHNADKEDGIIEMFWASCDAVISPFLCVFLLLVGLNW